MLSSIFTVSKMADKSSHTVGTLYNVHYSVHFCLTEEAFNVNWQNILLTEMTDFAVEARIHFIFYLTTRHSIFFLLRVLYERKNRSRRVSVSSELCIGCIFGKEFDRIS